MSHLDVILITGGLFLISTLGVCAAVRCINHHTNPPVNSIWRRGDIELQYIEPSRNNNLDLVQPDQVFTLGRTTDSLIENSSERISYEVITNNSTNNPPSYHTLDLVQPQQVYSYERVPSGIPTSWNGSNIPSYQNTSTMNFYSEDSMNLQSIPLNIYSCLEDSLNLNYNILFMVVVSFIIIIIISKLR